MNLEKHWDFHESCTQNFSPIYNLDLDPKLFVSILTFRVLKCKFLTKFASFLFDRYRTEKSLINYLLKKYTYALIEISPMSNG